MVNIILFIIKHFNIFVLFNLQFNTYSGNSNNNNCTDCAKYSNGSYQYHFVHNKPGQCVADNDADENDFQILLIILIMIVMKLVLLILNQDHLLYIIVILVITFVEDILKIII